MADRASGRKLFLGRLLVDGIVPAARREAALLAHDGRVVAVGSDAVAAAGSAAERIDLCPLVLVAGLVDSHVHLVLGAEGGGLFSTMGDTDGRMLLRAVRNLRQALAAATARAAWALGLEAEIGVLAPGRCADLVAVESDPLEDIGSLGRVRAVFRDGRRLL